MHTGEERPAVRRMPTPGAQPRIADNVNLQVGGHVVAPPSSVQPARAEPRIADDSATQTLIQQAVTAGIAAHLAANNSSQDRAIADLRTQMAAMQEEFRLQWQGAMHQHTSIMETKNAEINAAQRTEEHLRTELRDAMHYGSCEAVAAKQHEAATETAEQQLGQARAHHRSTMEVEARASRDAAALAVRHAEAEAEPASNARIDNDTILESYQEASTSSGIGPPSSPLQESYSASDPKVNDI